MKTLLLIISIALTACTNSGYILPTISQDKKFQCDMDPLKQRCASPRDYERHMRNSDR
jgi:hypothetical protein